MGGLADEETAAMLVAHEVGESEVGGIADIEPGMEEAKFVAKVVSIGEVRTFERDGEDEDGRVANVEVADETGSVRRRSGTTTPKQPPKNSRRDRCSESRADQGGLSGVEVSVDDVEPDDDTEIEVQVSDTHTVESLSLGLSNVNLVGLVLDTDSVRTFDRDDGTEGKVSNLVVGDSTGRVRVTLWDERADLAEEIDPGTTIEVIDGYVRERDGSLEVHVGNRGAIEDVDEDIEYVPESTPIEDVEIGQTVDLAGVVRSADPKRTFDRDDGSEGQVRNIRVQDATGDIRVALWGQKADIDIGPGDEVALGDVEIQDGWQDDLEASAGWQSTITVLDTDSDTGRTQTIERVPQARAVSVCRRWERDRLRRRWGNRRLGRRRGNAFRASADRRSGGRRRSRIYRRRRPGRGPSRPRRRRDDDERRDGYRRGPRRRDHGTRCRLRRTPRGQ